jgi:hypothetical protein
MAPEVTMDNAYLEDAIYCLRRASGALRPQMSRDGFYDAAIYYAFGMEKLFKAIVHDVNPVFLLETHSFENAASVLYGGRLIESARKKTEDKGGNRSLIPFQASMLRAAKFSHAVEDNIGRFTKLADIRGALAHRSWEEVDRPEATDFMLLTFAPTVELFARELDFEPDACFESPDDRRRLTKASTDLAAQENYGEYITAELAKHLAIWEARRGQPGERDKAESFTRSVLDRFRSGGAYAQPSECPCCKQEAVLFYRFLDRYAADEVVTVGVYATGLACMYCDIQLSGYRAVDYFKLNDLVQASFGGKRRARGYGDSP